MSDFLSYCAFRMVETIARLLPASVAWRLGAGLGMLGYWLSPHYRRLLARNLTIAFSPEMNAGEIKALAKRHMRLLGGNFLAGMKIPWMKPEAIRRCFEIEGQEHATEALSRGSGLVYVLMHMGNWELLSHAAVMTPGGIKGGALFQGLHNKRVNAHVLRCRERTGCRLFDREDGFHAPATFVKEGNALGVLADQRAGAKGVWAPFFGRLASTTTLPALIAKRAGAPMVPVGVITVAPGRWRVVISEEIPGISPGLSAEESAAIMNERLEAIISRSPADWFWVHNRWRTPKPEILLTNARRGLALGNERGVDELVPFEIIIRAPDSLTDACFALPAVRAIRRGRPDSHITVFTCAATADFWRMDPEVDEVLVFPDDAGVSEAARLVRDTGINYDAGILFTEDAAGAKAFKKAGVPLLAGYEAGRKRLLDIIIPPRKNPGPIVHRSRDFLRIALRLGANVDDATLMDLLPGAAGPGTEFIAAIAPGATNETARWPVEKFAEAVKLAAIPGVKWLILGTADEKPLGAKLAAALGPQATDLTGTTSVRELAAQLQRCQVLIANDNGALHLAAMLGIPVIGIYGPTEPELTRPQGSAHTILRRHVECSPCFLESCAMDHRCMKELPAERAAAALRARLHSTPAYA